MLPSCDVATLDVVSIPLINVRKAGNVSGSTVPSAAYAIALPPSGEEVFDLLPRPVNDEWRKLHAEMRKDLANEGEGHSKEANNETLATYGEQSWRHAAVPHQHVRIQPFRRERSRAIGCC
jgi:hypothetical protein